MMIEDTKSLGAERQLLSRGIYNERIINAFSTVDREDFVEPKYKMYAYADIEIPVCDKNNRFLLRPYLLAKIAKRILSLPHEKILIIGDYCNYTLFVFNCIFENYSFVGEQKLYTYEQKDFDIVFFDAGIYNKAAIDRGLELVSSSGTVIFLSRRDAPRFSLSLQDCPEVCIEEAKK